MLSRTRCLHTGLVLLIGLSLVSQPSPTVAADPTPTTAPVEAAASKPVVTASAPDRVLAGTSVTIHASVSPSTSIAYLKIFDISHGGAFIGQITGAAGTATWVPGKVGNYWLRVWAYQRNSKGQIGNVAYRDIFVMVTATMLSRTQLATRLMYSGAVEFRTYHDEGTDVRGRDASARANIVDAAAGRAAFRSTYGTAPGGQVWLSILMLEGLVRLTQEYDFRVTEITGGSHSAGSRHYSGVAFDVSAIHGKAVNRANPYYKAFMARCRDFGATEVLGPGDPDHDTHVHCAWTP